MVVGLQHVFFYTDFNETLGLTLNGNSATTNCIFKPINAYGVNYAMDDALSAQLDVIQSNTIDRVALETTDTSTPTSTSKIAADTAMFGNRDAYTPSTQTECPVRLRLTASQPNQASSVWYNDPLNVLDGFETHWVDHRPFPALLRGQGPELWSPRVHSKSAQNPSLVTSPLSCYVHGGDGFAFVVHGSPSTTTALGQSGRSLGWESISNSIAVVFDTRPYSDTTDLFVDHVRCTFCLSSSSSTVAPSIHVAAANAPPVQVSVPAPHDLADGSIHVVKVRYYNTLPLQYFASLSATTDLTPFLKDVAEERRVGCLLVFMDDGITQDTPLVAVPINLAVALRLPDDVAYVGFTAATGSAWEKHDILAWYYCAQPPCLDVSGQTVALEFDYGTQTNLFSVSYGTSLYPQVIFPQTDPWGFPQAYFAPGVPTGVV
ncbi:Aste57867_23262 [Aphanomyces stellatus]|uniref:Aste57867_23262 protein n=1 Tax=Aphanomyces stellatus TaxID=120398 RepID=A0A485LMC6_9STRA|nr:hypothetical protein As57867_023191 [Aphanomyces stellatus]VFT99907.1 Aste57867_23262 [Aphanomyces stellatus]